MAQRDDPQDNSYPIGRGYGHDYMRGGELLGGYGYSARPDYERRRGEGGDREEQGAGEDRDAGDDDGGGVQQRTRRQPNPRPPERPLSAS